MLQKVVSTGWQHRLNSSLTLHFEVTVQTPTDWEGEDKMRNNIDKLNLR